MKSRKVLCFPLLPAKFFWGKSYKKRSTETFKQADKNRNVHYLQSKLKRLEEIASIF